MNKGKTLGIWMCTALVVGNMIGSGVFLLPASLAPFGTLGLFGWLLTTAGALLLALIFARLARAYPAVGGPYAYAREGFGDFVGFLVAWGYWSSIWAGNAAIAVAFVGYLGWFFPVLGTNPVASGATALCAIWGLTAINCRGIREAGVVQLATTVLKLLPLVLIALFGLFYLEPDHFSPINPSGGNPLSIITAAGALTLWAFLGLESATIPAGEVVDPEKTIPRATVLGTLIAAAVYIFSTVAVMGVVDGPTLAQSTAPFADAAQAMWGPWAGNLVAAGAMIATFGALNGWIMMQGQIPLAVAQDGLFPKAFARLSKGGAPVFGLVISSVVVTVLMAANYTRSLVDLYTFVILLSTLNTLVPYVFAVAGEWLIRKKHPQRFAKATALTMMGSALAFVYVLWAIGGSGADAVYWGFLLMMAGVPVYVWLRTKERES